MQAANTPHLGPAIRASAPGGRPARGSRLAGDLAGLGLLLALAGCAAGPPVGAPSLSHDPVARLAQEQLGRPYRYGGEGPEAFDCSGLVQYAYREGAGVEVPRTARDQLDQATRVPTRVLRPGDLVFFQPGAGKDLHVGIYVEDDLFVHAPSPGGRVTYARLTDRFWRESLVAAGRLR